MAGLDSCCQRPQPVQTLCGRAAAVGGAGRANHTKPPLEICLRRAARVAMAVTTTVQGGVSLARCQHLSPLFGGRLGPRTVATDL